MGLLNGEVEFQAGGKTYVFCLRMRELAELNEAFGVAGGDLMAFRSRFGEGNVFENISGFVKVALRRNHPDLVSDTSSDALGELISDLGISKLLQLMDKALVWCMPEPPDPTRCQHCGTPQPVVATAVEPAPNVEAPPPGGRGASSSRRRRGRG